MADASMTTVKIPGVANRRVVIDANGDAAVDEMQSPTGESLLRIFGLDPAMAGPAHRVIIPREMRNEIADALRISED